MGFANFIFLKAQLPVTWRRVMAVDRDEWRGNFGNAILNSI